MPVGIKETLFSKTADLIDWSEVGKQVFHRELLFVSDKATYEFLRDEEYNSQEFAVLRKYLDDSDLRVLVQCGLAMRELQNKDQDRVQELRSDIKRKYSVGGLHIAQAAQSGFLWSVAQHLVSEDMTNAGMTAQFTEFVENIDKYMVFAKNTHDVDSLTKEAGIQLSAHKPNLYAVAGRGDATDIATEVAANIEQGRVDYNHVNQEQDESGVIHIFQLDEVYS